MKTSINVLDEDVASAQRETTPPGAALGFQVDNVSVTGDGERRRKLIRGDETKPVDTDDDDSELRERSGLWLKSFYIGETGVRGIGGVLQDGPVGNFEAVLEGMRHGIG